MFGLRDVLFITEILAAINQLQVRQTRALVRRLPSGFVK